VIGTALLLLLLAPFSSAIPCFTVGAQDVARLISDSLYVVAPITLLILYALGRPEWAALGLLLLVTLSLTLVLKCVFYRPRPLTVPEDCDVRTLGYPSAHASTATALALGVSKYLPNLGPAAWAYAVLVYWSRIELCEHYPLDVVGGMLVAMLVFGTLQ